MQGKNYGVAKKNIRFDQKRTIDKQTIKNTEQQVAQAQNRLNED